MSAHGGTVSIETERARRARSSPGRSAASSAGRRSRGELGLRNVLCTDIGGTSFDIALITDGRFEITQTPDIARFLLNMPLVRVDSIGAGHRLVRARQPELQPSRARARTRPARASASRWPPGGLETVSVTDLNLVLGRLNPDYFLGGEVDLDVERARAAVERQLARPLGLSV